MKITEIVLETGIYGWINEKDNTLAWWDSDKTNLNSDIHKLDFVPTLKLLYRLPLPLKGGPYIWSTKPLQRFDKFDLDDLIQYKEDLKNKEPDIEVIMRRFERAAGALGLDIKYIPSDFALALHNAIKKSNWGPNDTRGSHPKTQFNIRNIDGDTYVELRVKVS